MAKKAPTLEVFENKSVPGSADEALDMRRTEYYWRLRAKNGEIICTSEAYKTKGNAVRAAKRVAPLMEEACLTYR